MKMTAAEPFAPDTQTIHTRINLSVTGKNSNIHGRVIDVENDYSAVGSDDQIVNCSFSDVIRQLQGAGNHIRGLEEKIEQFKLVRDVEPELRLKLKSATDRASLAEAKAQEANARATIAEERARKAEQWLLCIRQTIRDEFHDIPT